MNFVESTSFFVRVTMYEFIHPKEKINLRFKIIPMIHIGSKQFYKEVFQYLNECEEVIYEGVHSSKIKQITNRYKLAAKNLGLVLEREHLNLRALNCKLIHADYTKEISEQEWTKLRWREKLDAKFIIPIYLFFRYRNLTRRKLAKAFMTSAEEAYLAYGPREDEIGTFRNYVMNAREQIVFKKIQRKVKHEFAEDKTVAILYGAGHMKSITRYLIDKCGYILRRGTFIEVFKVY